MTQWKTVGERGGRRIRRGMGVALLGVWTLPAQALWMYTPFDTNMASTMQGLVVHGTQSWCEPEGGTNGATIAAPFAFRNDNPNEPHLYQAYTLSNNGPERCVSVKPVWTHQDCGNLQLGMGLYLGSFNPNDPTENLIAHSRNPGGGSIHDYYYTSRDNNIEVNAIVPAMANVVVVIDSPAQPGDNLQCPVDNATSSFGITSGQLSGTPLTVEVHDTSNYEGNPPGVGGYLTYYVWLSTQFDGTFTVDYTTSDGSAVVGGPNPDYTATSGQLTFLPGETVKVVQVPILGDTDIEANETVTLTLSNPSSPYVALADATATGTIYDDDDLTGTCHIVNYTGGGDLPLGKVGQAYTPGGPVDLQPDGNQDPADDYEWAITAGSLPPGVNLTTFTGGDTELWGRLSGTPTQAGTYDFTLRLRCPLAPDPGWDTYEVPFQIIVEAETPQAILTLPDVTVVEGNAGLTPVNMAFQLSQALPDDLPLEIVLFDGSATVVDPDYQQLMSIPQPTQITAGNTVEPFQLNVLGDVKVEGNETYLVQVRTPVEKTVLATATVTILNDDASPATPVPVLSLWGLGALAGTLGALGLRFRRKGQH